MQVVSTMGSGSLGRELDLEAFVAELENQLDDIDSNFQTPSMVTIRLEEEGPAYTVYRTGSFQIRGAKSVDLLEEAVGRFQEILEDIEVETPSFEFEISTLVCMGDLEQKLDLETLAVSLGLNKVEYEPEQFPGLIFRPDGYGVTLLIFATGNVITGGAEDRNQAKSALDYMKEKLCVRDGASS